MNREDIYLAAPTWLQNALISFEGFRICRSRYGGGFKRLLNEYENRLSWEPERVCMFRDERLRSFVAHCRKNVPYYRNLFGRLKFSEDDIRSIDDLKMLPVLDKATVQAHIREFSAENISPALCSIVHTSGTTGAGLRFAATKHALCEQWAVWWRYRRMHGITMDTWCGYFGGRSIVPSVCKRPPFWRINYPCRQILFSGYHMSEKNMKWYIDQLNRRHPPWLHGYPSLLSLLASFMVQRGITLDYELKWITTGAENLLENQAAIIYRAFGIRPLQHYGMAEAVANISEHRDGTLRVDEDFSAVEFLPTSNGTGFRIIGTNFSNFATPLLRYDTGDIAQLPEDKSCCNSSVRTVRAIDGRQEDYIVLRDGTKLGRLDHLFKDMVNVIEAQFCQNIPGEILVRIRKSENYSGADEQLLLNELRHKIGDGAAIQIEYVDNIPRGPNAKLRFVVSHIKENKIVG